MISVLILTRNEERNLPAVLANVSWSDDIVVFDSFSTDRTVEIAKAAGARVIQREFDNERNQREASLRVGFKHAWVYNPDADELAEPELIREMQEAVNRIDRGAVAYRVRFKTMFFGRWIRHSSLYPTWVIRLFRPECVSFEREINLVYVIKGPEGRFNSHFLHYTFNNGISAWFDKHNKYSDKEALESQRELRPLGVCARELLSRSSVDRRRALKELSIRMPLRPFFRFIYMYFVRAGFLDGRAGLTYCTMLTAYEYMIVLKIREAKLRKREASRGLL